MSRPICRRVASCIPSASRYKRPRTFGDTYVDKVNHTAARANVINYQMGINGGVVYNLTPQVHFDLDYFRAKAAWFLGESQVLNVTSAGLTFNW